MERTITMANIQAIFIDRDGTIGGDTTIHYPGSFTLFPFTKASLQKLKANHIKIFSFTNQPGIADGIATIADFSQELKASVLMIFTYVLTNTVMVVNAGNQVQVCFYKQRKNMGLI